jgi:hypothetical protein
MPTDRFTSRYSDQAITRKCDTPACSRQTRSSVSGLCDHCRNNFRRLGHVDQVLPATAELDKFVRRLEEARGRLKHLDLEALEARWDMLVDDCRAKATPTYKDQRVLSYNGWEREGSALIRDIAENISFTRALDLLGAIHLMNIERPGVFKSDDGLACRTVELFRRTSRVGCKVMAMNSHNGTIEKSYRREMSRNSRLATARLLNLGLGAAAVALAKREAKRADEAKATRESYWAGVAAIESAASA